MIVASHHRSRRPSPFWRTHRMPELPTHPYPKNKNLTPLPYAALIGALLLRILAYTMIAGKSAANDIVLSGIWLL